MKIKCIEEELKKRKNTDDDVDGDDGKATDCWGLAGFLACVIFRGIALLLWLTVSEFLSMMYFVNVMILGDDSLHWVETETLRLGCTFD